MTFDVQFEIDDKSFTLNETSAAAAEAAAERAEAAAEQAEAFISNAIDATLSIEGKAADAKAAGDAIDTLSGKIDAAFATDTASSTVASFSDGADSVPVKSLSVEVEAVQSGSGDPSPDNVRPISGWDSVKVTRTGVNLANSEKMLLIGSDVTYTEADGYYFPRNFSNISDACAVFVNESKLPMQLSLAYDVKHSGDEGDGSIIRINYTDGTYTRSASSTTPADEWRHVTVTSDPNKVISSVKYSYLRPTRPTWIKNIQLNVGDTASDYEPYNGTVYPIALPQTVYGGTLDVSTGVLTVDHAMVDIGTFSWSMTDATNHIFRAAGLTGHEKTNYINYMCSALTPVNTNMSTTVMPDNSCKGNFNVAAYLYVKMNAYSDAASLKAALNGVQCVYKLEESAQQTIQLTPTEVATLLGQNNIYADSGEVSVTYRADTGLYINKRLNA